MGGTKVGERPTYRDAVASTNGRCAFLGVHSLAMETSEESPRRARSASPPGPSKTVGFVSVQERKLSAMDEAALKHAAARKMMEAREKAAKTKVKKTGAAVTDRDGNPFSFKLENYRTLDSVKGLPSRDKKRGPSRHAHASGTRSEGRGASADSPSRASTSLTVRSAVQIRADRAFKENFNAVRAELQQPEQLAQLITGLKPLDAEGGQRGIGKDVTRVWKAKLRELTPQHSSHAQPVANNAMSRDGVPLKQPPGFFCQVP
jgi:hypothetical protein